MSNLGRRWNTDANGVVHFSVTSDGTTGEAWVRRLKGKGYKIDGAVKVLKSPFFVATSGVTTKIQLLPGTMIETKNLNSKSVRAEARKHKLVEPNTEAACLIREYLSDEDFAEMNLWSLIVMHQPVKIEPYYWREEGVGGHQSRIDSLLLVVGRWIPGKQMISVSGRPGYGWQKADRFAFGCL